MDSCLAKSVNTINYKLIAQKYNLCQKNKNLCQKNKNLCRQVTGLKKENKKLSDPQIEFLFFVEGKDCVVDNNIGNNETFKISCPKSTTIAKIFTNIPYHISANFPDMASFFKLVTASGSNPQISSKNSLSAFEEKLIENFNTQDTSFIDKRPNSTITVINREAGTSNLETYVTIPELTDVSYDANNIIMTFEILPGNGKIPSSTHDIVSITIDDLNAGETIGVIAAGVGTAAVIGGTIGIVAGPPGILFGAVVGVGVGLAVGVTGAIIAGISSLF